MSTVHWVGPHAERDPTCWPGHIADQALDVLLGDCLGAGISRAVFVLAWNDRLVAKVETKARSFQNVTEFQTWQDASGTYAKWLAPCWAISGSGKVLIQSRTDPIPAGERFKVPSWMQDRSRKNFGRLDGRIVCHDYGLMSSSLVAGGKLVPVEG